MTDRSPSRKWLRADYPALYLSASDASRDGQRSFTRSLKLRLAGLLGAAVGGLVSWRVDSIEIGGVIALVGFAVAVSAGLYAGISKPERQWYDGRAIAESAKTLAWRYSIAGAQFPASLDASSADKGFLSELFGVLRDLKSVDLPANVDASQQITDRMRESRSATLAERIALYERERILNQHSWYSKGANDNRTRARGWSIAGAAVEGSGVLAASLRAFAGIDVDLLGLLAAIGAGIAAWQQAKQHQTLARSYGVAAQELAKIRSELAGVADEDAWAPFVDHAEDAISREHRLWRASRGVPLQEW